MRKVTVTVNQTHDIRNEHRKIAKIYTEHNVSQDHLELKVWDIDGHDNLSIFLPISEIQGLADFIASLGTMDAANLQPE